MKPKDKNAFDAQAFLDSAGMMRRIVKYLRSERIHSQGDPATTVLYIQRGGVKLSVVNPVGKDAVVAILGPGDFFGEGSIAGQSVRVRTATAITPTTILAIEKNEMIRVLHSEHEFSDRFISYMLSRNIRIEEDLIDQLFNSSEKRLARALLLLARYGREQPQKMLPKVSQEMLAEMIGATRSRVNFFMANLEGWVLLDMTAVSTSILPSSVLSYTSDYYEDIFRRTNAASVGRRDRIRLRQVSHWVRTCLVNAIIAE